MAGTLLLLREAGWDLHCMTLSSGNCGSVTMDSRATAAARRAESQAACALLSAVFHPSLTRDLEILYTTPLLRRLAAVIRQARPQILLVPSPQDYMEDHATTCRLAVTAAFGRGAPNFSTVPPRAAVPGDVTVYHAMPHGLRDSLRQRIRAGFYADTSGVLARKREALACHKSQKDWLDVSQGLGSYLAAMEAMSAEVGRMSKRFEHAEGWRRHLHYGFCGPQADPLAQALGDKGWIDPDYEAALERPV